MVVVEVEESPESEDEDDFFLLNGQPVMPVESVSAIRSKVLV